MPAELGVQDFGLLPRERYPLVAVLTLADPEAREAYNIVGTGRGFVESHFNCLG